MIDIWEKIKGWKLPFFGLVCFIFALISVLARTDPPPREPIVTPPSSPFENTTAGIGIIEPKSELIAISTELSGVVRDIHVEVGQKVAKSDILFSLDQRDIDAEIEILTAKLESSRIQAKDAMIQYDIIKNVKDKRAVAKDDYNRRKYAAALSKTRVNEIEAQLNQAKTTKKRLTVVAPINGTILDINIRPGEFATAGMLSEPLMRMGDTSTLHVRVEFDEEHANVSKDAKVIAYKRGDPSTSYPLTFYTL